MTDMHYMSVIHLGITLLRKRLFNAHQQVFFKKPNNWVGIFRFKTS